MSGAPARRQRGVALLTAVLVVALAAILVAMILDDGNAALARTRNALRAEQADALSQGLESWAVRVLRQERQAEGDVDRRNDAWAAGLPPTDVPGGRVMGALADLDGRYNLNNLVGDAGVPNAVQRQRFERLLRALKLDPALVDPVVDWIDPDGEAGARGAEDAWYLQQQPPYRAANRRMMHVSELRLVRGVTAEVYAALAPHVTALPRATASADGVTPVNVNTATAAVLQSLDERITEGLARRYVESGASWASPADFATELQKLGVVAPPAAIEVKSEWFVARAEIELDGIGFVYSSLIERGARNAVVARSRGAW